MPVKDSNPFPDKSFGANANGWFSSTCNAKLPEEVLHDFPPCGDVHLRCGHTTVVSRLEKLSRVNLPILSLGVISTFPSIKLTSTF